jgi:hypothetical protein
MPHVWQWLKNLQVLDVSVNAVTNILQGDLDGLESLHSLQIHDLTMYVHFEKVFASVSNLVELKVYGYLGLGYRDVCGILPNLPALEKLNRSLKMQL